jgi:hypothetical protein
MDRLALRLHGMLESTHRALGLPPEPLQDLLRLASDQEIHLYEVSPSGVLAFIGDYVLCAWPDDEMRVACRASFRLLSARLKERGFTRHMVHPRNFRSVKLTRKMGAVPVGYDEDRFMHYILHSANFPHHEDRAHGQEVAAAPAA